MMRFETKPGSWDLIWIFILTFLFTLTVLLLPEFELIRILLGIPFLVFFPGYVLTSLLFPRKYKEDVEEETIEPTKKTKGSFRIRMMNKMRAKEKVEDQRTEIKNKTIDIPIRIGLSVGLSLGIVPIIGYILGELYSLNSTFFGLNLIPILISIYSFTMIIGLLALLRRQRIPREERFQVKINIGPFSDGSKKDKLITSVLVILIIISIGSAIYMYKFNHENEKFTEFFILGPNKTIADYPTRFLVNEEQNIYLGIKNHEFSDKEYYVRVFLDTDIGETKELFHFRNLKIEQNTIYEIGRWIGHGDSILEDVNFQIPDSGSPVLNFVLYLDEKPYRSLRLKPQVFEKTDLLDHDNGSVVYFLSGPNGIPSNFPTRIFQDELFEIEAGIVNYHNNTITIKLYLSITEPEYWLSRNETTGIAELSTSSGTFSHIVLAPQTEVITNYSIKFPKGLWELDVRAVGENIDFTITKTINVR